MNLTVSSMNAEEIALAVDWAAREGWNPGLHDAACLDQKSTRLNSSH